MTTSRRFLLSWLTDLTKIKIEKIEDVGKGVHLCIVLTKIKSKNPINEKNIIKDPQTEIEYLKNLKICQSFFAENNINLFFPIERMCKCKVQDNLEFLQLFYKYFGNKFTSEKINHEIENNDEVINEAKKNEIKKPKKCLEESDLKESVMELSFSNITIRDTNNTKEFDDTTPKNKTASLIDFKKNIDLKSFFPGNTKSKVSPRKDDSENINNSKKSSVTSRSKLSEKNTSSSKSSLIKNSSSSNSIKNLRFGRNTSSSEINKLDTKNQKINNLTDKKYKFQNNSNPNEEKNKREYAIPSDCIKCMQNDLKKDNLDEKIKYYDRKMYELQKNEEDYQEKISEFEKRLEEECKKIDYMNIQNEEIMKKRISEEKIKLMSEYQNEILNIKKKAEEYISIKNTEIENLKKNIVLLEKNIIENEDEMNNIEEKIQNEVDEKLNIYEESLKSLKDDLEMWKSDGLLYYEILREVKKYVGDSNEIDDEIKNELFSIMKRRN